MNKKKIIFLIALGIFIVAIAILAIIFGDDTKVNNKLNTNSTNLKIWILEDSEKDFNSFLEDFKSDTNNQNLSVTVESFKNYEEYNMALSSAIVKGEAPDLYMLNNNEKSIFLENAIGIDPEIISPDTLRTYFYPFFGDDLIYSSGEKDSKTEFIVGVPFGFETMGLYFNLRRINDVKKLNNFSNIENLIKDFNEKKPGLTALGIGKGKSVHNSNDIFTQFLMSDEVSSFSEVTPNTIKKIFSEYFSFNSSPNGYLKIDETINKEDKTNIDYFVNGDIGMIFGYPRLLEEIDKKGFSKSRLRVVPFPDFVNESDKLVNYNYFVLNKNSKNTEIAYNFMKYLFSEKGQQKYLKVYKYYLPARISLYSDIKNREINDSFYIKLKDFFNSEANYSSFNKGLKYYFDTKIENLLDDEVNYLDRASKFFNALKCKTTKIIKLENLSKVCE